MWLNISLKNRPQASNCVQAILSTNTNISNDIKAAFGWQSQRPELYRSNLENRSEWVNYGHYCTIIGHGSKKNGDIREWNFNLMGLTTHPGSFVFISIIIIGLCLFCIQSLKTLKQTAQEIRKVWFKKNPQVRESQGRAQLWSRWKSFTRAASPRRTSSSTGRSSTATPSRWIMSRTAFRSKEHATLIVPTTKTKKSTS